MPVAELLKLLEVNRARTWNLSRAVGMDAFMVSAPRRCASTLSFPAGILNFESSCGVCDSWDGRGSAVVTAGSQVMMDACWARLVIAAL
jgi:hypothetical protein